MDTPYFFGRENELSRLETMLERVLQGFGQTAFIAGESGTGKTTLIEAFIERAQKKSSTLLSTMTTCDSQTGRSDAYLPFLETLAQFSGDVDRFRSPSVSRINTDRMGSVVTLASQSLIESAPDLIGGFIPDGSIIIDAVRATAESSGWEDRFERTMKNARLEGTIQSEKIFQLYTDVLLNISVQGPLLLVIDDIHWVDPSSAQLFFHLSRRITHAPVFLIGSYRPNDMAMERDGERHPMLSVLHEVKRNYGDIVIELGKESTQERETFVSSLLNAEPNRFKEDFRQAFIKHTQGHPLFSCELLKSFQERRVIIHDDDGCWVQDRKIDWEDLPARVEGVIEERIGRLQDDLRNLLDVASVQGIQFQAQVVARLQKMTDRILLQRLSQDLERRHGLIVEDNATRIGDMPISRYRFAHHMFQTYLYKELGEGERMILHAEVGALMEEMYGERKDEVAVQLAYHFGAAEKWEKAIQYSFKAVRRFLKVSSYDSAFKHLVKALGQASQLNPGDARAYMVEIYVLMAGIHQALKGYVHPVVEQTFKKAYQLADESAFPVHRATAIYGLWQISISKLKLGKALKFGREIEAIASSNDDSVLKVIACRALANVHYQKGDLGPTVEDCDLAVENYDPEKVAGYLVPLTYDPKVFAIGQRSWAESLQGYFSKARETKAEMFAWAEELNHPISTCVAHLCALKLEFNFQDEEAIREHSILIRELAAEHKFPWYAAFGDLFDAWLEATEASEDDFNDAVERLVRIYNEGVARGGNLLIHSQFSRMITDCMIRKHRWDDALDWVEKGIQLAVKKAEFIYVAELLRMKAQALLMKGDLDRALEQFRESIHLAKQKGHRLFELRARVSLCHAIKPFEEPFNEAVIQLKPLVHTLSDDTECADLKNALELLQE